MPGLSCSAMAQEATKGLFSGALSHEFFAFEEKQEQNPTAASEEGTFSVDLYRAQFGDFGLAFSGAYRGSSVDDQSVQAVSDDGYMVGLRLDYGGISLASEWRAEDGKACSEILSECSTGTAWNIGAIYVTGAASLYANYQTDNPLNGLHALNGPDVYQFGVNYEFFEGFSSRANAYFIDGDEGLVEGDSAVILIGTRVTF